VFVLFIWSKNCMTTSESKGRFFYKTNRFEYIRITNRIESIRIANRNALLSGTHYQKLSLIITLLLCFSLGWRHSSSPVLSLFPLLSSTLPGPSASEVTTLWGYTNAFIIIIIIIYLDLHFAIEHNETHTQTHSEMQTIGWALHTTIQIHIKIEIYKTRNHRQAGRRPPLPGTPVRTHGRTYKSKT